MNAKKLSLAAGLLVGGSLWAALAAQPDPQMTAKQKTVAVFRKDGTLERPKGYRSWIFIGAPLTPNDMNNGKAAFPEFHSVYVDPASYEAYKQTGEWRDGTMIVKELVTVGSKSSSSGKGYFMGDFIGLEAVLKSAERFPDEPGHWGFFRFTDEAGGPVHDMASVLPTASCASCHQAAADEDGIFTQHYPVLRAASRFGDGQPEDR